MKNLSQMTAVFSGKRGVSIETERWNRWQVC